MALNAIQRTKLELLVIRFDASGGRGVELADEIDRLRAIDEDYNVCAENADGKHGPIEANYDREIGSTHFSVACKACGITTGHPLPDPDELEWN